MESLRARRLVAAGTAAAVAAVDLAQKALAGASLHHDRGPAAMLVMAAVAGALLLVVPRIPSLPVALGAGIGAGGALANLLSLLVWSRGVPDPLVRGTIAFNLADVAVLLGDALMLASAAVFALRNRARLRESF
jgi:lipoprotein signal peptidase